MSLGLVAIVRNRLLRMSRRLPVQATALRSTAVVCRALLLLREADADSRVLCVRLRRQLLRQAASALAMLVRTVVSLRAAHGLFERQNEYAAASNAYRSLAINCRGSKRPKRQERLRPPVASASLSIVA
jgi:hypothetical protein